MASLTFSASELSRTIRFDGAAFSPPAVRKAGGLPQTTSDGVTVVGSPAVVGDITLVSSESWLSCPATAADGVAFTIDIDASALPAGDHQATITASAGGYPDGDLSVSLMVQPAAPKP